VLDAIFPGRRGEADDRRHVAEAVEETIRRKIDIAFGAARRNPADRARSDDGVERIVLEAVAVPGFVEVQVFCSHADNVPLLKGRLGPIRRPPSSFRDGAPAPDPESRDSQMCNCTSELDALASPRNDG